MAGFDSKKFLKTKFRHRTADVPVPDMREFFPDGEAPVWTVRGLTGQELGRANEYVDSKTRDKVLGLIKALAGGSQKEVEESAGKFLGAAGGAPEDIAKRIQHLVMGSVNPACSHDLAVKICEVFPIEFFEITNRIFQLTGQGQDPGKSKPSGGTAESETASLSAPSEGDSSMK